MGWTSSKHHVTLVDAHENKFQNQKPLTIKIQMLNYKFTYFASTALGLGSGFVWWLCYFLLSCSLLHCYALYLSTQQGWTGAPAQSLCQSHVSGINKCCSAVSHQKELFDSFQMVTLSYYKSHYQLRYKQNKKTYKFKLEFFNNVWNQKFKNFEK